MSVAARGKSLIIVRKERHRARCSCPFNHLAKCVRLFFSSMVDLGERLCGTGRVPEEVGKSR